MKTKLNKKSNLIMLIFISMGIVSCGPSAVTSSNSGSSNSAVTTSTSGGTSSTTAGGSSNINGCDGIPRAGATQCYYKNLPQIALSGPGSLGVTYWSSASNLANYGIDPNQFATDATFSVRMIPSYITDGRTSANGRTCGQYLSQNYTTLQVSVMLHKSGVSVGETATLVANYTNGAWQFSNTYRYNVPSGTTSPFILDVVGVQSNDRCTNFYGTPPANCTLMDIPVNSVTTYPTECVGFTLQMATDSTYDLPN